ncbi:MAG: transposase [Propioniciclava sp.]|uniref:transposase n=1 Tax=Propioniciclava sp. TaxID=2038686 RepID=UPI0039E3C32E
MLLTADRGFFSYALWRKAIGTGVDMLRRIRTDKSGPKPVHVEDLPDGSWLADLRQTHSAATRAAEPMRVRFTEYTLDDGRENATSHRLFTTILDPGEATATDLAAAYSRRWEIESAFDEFKTHQRGPRTILRSKSPDLSQKRAYKPDPTGRLVPQTPHPKPSDKAQHIRDPEISPRGPTQA